MQLKFSATTLGFKEKRMGFVGIEILRFILALMVFFNHVLGGADIEWALFFPL
jgi:hypothetical protein